MNRRITELVPTAVLAVLTAGSTLAAPAPGYGGGVVLGSRGVTAPTVVVAPVVFEGNLGTGAAMAAAARSYDRTDPTKIDGEGAARVITPLAAQREALLARVVQDTIRQSLSISGRRGATIVPARHAARAEQDLHLSADALWLPPRISSGAPSPTLDLVNVRAFADRLGVDTVLMARARSPKVIEVAATNNPGGQAASGAPMPDATVTVDAQLVRARDGAVLWHEQQSVRVDAPDPRRVHRSLRGDPYQTLLDAAARAGAAIGASLRTKL